MQPTDSQLVEQFQKTADRGALDELLQRHIRTVRATVFQMVLNDAAADDVTQEVFLRVIRSLPKFNKKSAFSTWLYRIALNTTYTHLSRKASQKEETTDNPLPALTTCTPERTAIGVETGQEIHAALASLPADLRAAIVLTRLQQLPAAEAAKIEECTVNTMYWRVHEARKRLKKKLEHLL